MDNRHCGYEIKCDAAGAFDECVQSLQDYADLEDPVNALLVHRLEHFPACQANHGVE